MRVHLLLILFFASTVSARCARNRRNADTTTVEPPYNSTTKANDENTTTNVSRNECNGGVVQCIVDRLLKIMSKLIRPILQGINNVLSMLLKTLSSTGKFVIHATMQPFVVILKLIIRTIKGILDFLNI